MLALLAAQTAACLQPGPAPVRLTGTLGVTTLSADPVRRVAARRVAVITLDQPTCLADPDQAITRVRLTMRQENAALPFRFKGRHVVAIGRIKAVEAQPTTAELVSPTILPD